MMTAPEPPIQLELAATAADETKETDPEPPTE